MELHGQIPLEVDCLKFTSETFMVLKHFTTKHLKVTGGSFKTQLKDFSVCYQLFLGWND